MFPPLPSLEKPQCCDVTTTEDKSFYNKPSNEDDSTKKCKKESVEENEEFDKTNNVSSFAENFAQLSINQKSDELLSFSNKNNAKTIEPSSWVYNIFGCLKPVFNFIGKVNPEDTKNLQNDNWEIAFETISDLQWLGSGAQGAVFRGKYKNEVIAVKKVKDQKETDIKHLRKLNHLNIVQFKGVCIQAPCYCIVMEYCPYGPLYNLLKDGEEIPPGRFVSWAIQIASGMNYLHNNKIIHRDLKSPNVLIGQHEIVKISDFGTCREWNEISTKMSFAGTVAWMAPEIIRNEPCSEKVDIWSYGVVLWELLTCEAPYKDVDSSAIIWGVGSNSLHLPIPSSCPYGFNLLITQCWSEKPRNRPSFKHILLHLDTASHEVLNISSEEWFKMQEVWKEEIGIKMVHIQSNDSQKKFKDENRKREEELRHIQDIREHLEGKLASANQLCAVLRNTVIQLTQKEKKDRLRREKQSLKSYKKRITRSGSRTQDRTNKSIKNNWTSALLCRDTKPESLPESPVKVHMVTRLKTECSHPESVVLKSKKGRRRKSQISPKHSYRHLNFEYNTYNQPKNKVDTETQTDEFIDYSSLRIENEDILNGNVNSFRNYNDENSNSLGKQLYEITNNNNTKFHLQRRSNIRIPIGRNNRYRRKTRTFINGTTENAQIDNSDINLNITANCIRNLKNENNNTIPSKIPLCNYHTVGVSE
ncbi:hypothetical protein PGB90_001194 [Kerria lacca]